MSEALYRKYRPQIFEDVVGQEHIERTIKNAIESDKVSHAYLFTGPRGTGKTTTARLLAKALLCEKGPTPEPDGTCEDCQMIANGEHPDVYELDAASRTGVENVREEIIGRVQFAPTRGRYKIYIIDEVHMLSTAAFNALLKTLEEPPSHVVFILATTDPQKVPETIHSRCQRFDFRRISNESIVSRLGAICVAEGVEFEGEALDLIAHRAEGGMRNALTSLEQLIAFGEGRVTMEVAERMLGSLASSDLADIVRYVGTRDVAACFRWTAEFVETGADLAQFTRDLAEHMRNMYVMSLAGADVALDVSESARRELAEELTLFGPDRLARLLGVLGDLSAELKTSTNPRLSFEIALTRMVRPDSDLTLESLAERIEALESGYSAVAHVVAAPTSAESAGAGQVRADANAGGARALAGADGVCSASAQGQEAHLPRRESEGAPLADATARPQAARGGMVADANARSACDTRPDARSATTARATARATARVTSAASQARDAVDRTARDASVQGASAGQDSVPAAGNGMPAQLAASMQNPAALQRMWQAALSSLKKAKAAYGVLFLNTKASFDTQASTLVVDFPAENDFAFRAVQKPDVQDELASALAQACGCPVPFRLTKGGEGGFGAASAGVTPRTQPERVNAATTQAPAAGFAAATPSAGIASAAPSAAFGGAASSAVMPSVESTATSMAADAAKLVTNAVAGTASEQNAASRVDAVSQATPPAPYETPTGYAGYDDAVPVDLYEDMVPYEDEEFYEDAPACAAPASGESAAGSASPAARTASPVPSATATSVADAGSASFAAVAASMASVASAGSAAFDTSSDSARPAGPAAHAAPSASAGTAVSPAPDEPSLSDLDASLAFGFGEGVSFTEVRE